MSDNNESVPPNQPASLADRATEQPDDRPPWQIMGLPRARIGARFFGGLITGAVRCRSSRARPSQNRPDVNDTSEWQSNDLTKGLRTIRPTARGDFQETQP